MSNYRLTLSISLIALSLAVCGCAPSVKRAVNFYLVAQDVSPSQITPANLKTIELKKQAIISSKDIIWYSRATHQMQISPKAYRHIQNLYGDPLHLDGIPFVVMVGKERIYAGAFWTPISSQSYNGVINMQPIEENGNLISLSLGYPSIIFFKGKDPRTDNRIMQALDAAGKLK